MNKSDLITWLAVLPEDDPRLALIEDIRREESHKDSDEPRMTLKEVSKTVGYHPITLWKLGVRKVGESLGGRLRYQQSRVVEYLKSPECAERRDELRASRRRQVPKKDPESRSADPKGAAGGFQNE